MSRADSRSSRSDRPSGRRPRSGPGAEDGPARETPRRPEGGSPARGRPGLEAGRASRGPEHPAGTHRTSRPETGRTASSSAFIYGRNPVREALRGCRAVKYVFLVTGAVGDELERNLAAWAAETRRPQPPVRRMTPHELAEMLATGDHQGIAVEVESYPYAEPQSLLRGYTLLVALDEVQDPHNLGAVIRTATAAGAGVVIPRHRAAEITGAVVKASAGVTERAVVAQVRNLADFLSEAKQAGFWVYGATGGPGGDYSAQDYSYPTCFVMGSEGKGLGRRVASMCDAMVRIPLGGGVESLNVSVSAGILLYEAVRQRAGSEGGPGAVTSGAAAPDGGAIAPYGVGAVAPDRPGDTS